MIVPAAGLGSRLGADRPKLLVQVGGTAMIDRLARLYEPWVDRLVVVVHPAHLNLVERHISGLSLPASTVVQFRPTGMLDAILLAADAVSAGSRLVWITWCDQVAVHPDTVARLAQFNDQQPDQPVVLPTAHRTDPYTHFERDPSGRIIRVLHRREGNVMPDVGESDVGLFSLSAAAYRQDLPRFAQQVHEGAGTGERNFLPFIPWMASAGGVLTFPCVDPRESVGVNTAAELREVESYLHERERSQV